RSRGRSRRPARTRTRATSTLRCRPRSKCADPPNPTWRAHDGAPGGSASYATCWRGWGSSTRGIGSRLSLAGGRDSLFAPPRSRRMLVSHELTRRDFVTAAGALAGPAPLPAAATAQRPPVEGTVILFQGDAITDGGG